MHWGYKILVVIILFLLGMGYMVFTAMHQENEMYDEDYYAKELKYQSTLDAAQHLNAIYSGEILHDSAGTMVLQLPATTYESFKDGSIVMLRADDKNKDLKFPMSIDDKGMQNISSTKLSKGYYNTRISWTNDTTTFYKEQSIYIK